MKTVLLKIPLQKLGISIVVLLFHSLCAYGQPSLPTRSLEVSIMQQLEFGTFIDRGGGGSVTVGWDGIRSASGSIVLVNAGAYAKAAIFEMKLLQGRNVYIDFSATSHLIGRDGGSLVMNIGTTEKGGSGSYFSTSNNRDFETLLRVGGTLDIPAGATPGKYSGYYFITFNQE